MEYGLWNFHGGFWPGGNANSAPPEAISRNFYNSVNNDVESSSFHPTSPGKLSLCQMIVMISFDFFTVMAEYFFFI